MLYPLKFKPIFKEKIWGGQKLNILLNKKIPQDKKIGESWEISAVQDNISVVSNGFLAGNSLQDLTEIYMGDLVGDKIYNKFGIEFSLLIKFIDASDALSVQVHPNDKVAKERHNAFGKNEIWYIVEAEKESELILGFEKELNKQEYTEHLKNKKITQVLHNQAVQAGDVYFIPAGRIHAIGKGILLAEIQQTSDITYRIYDWDRTDSKGNSRELHTELALAVIDFNIPKTYKSTYKKTENKSNEIEKNSFFTINYLPITDSIEKDYSKMDTFVIYMVLSGKIEICDENSNIESVQKGESILIPAELENIKIKSEAKAELLEIYI